jgi:CheY-like chemotaxis protein
MAGNSPMEQGQRRVVLVVEDDAGSARAVAGLFERAGAQAVVCLDPLRAVERALEPDVALVSLDLSTPPLNRFEAVSLIRSHEQTRSLPSVPLVSVTGAATAEDRARSIAAGFVAHLAKPVDFEAIAGVLRSAPRLRAELYHSRYSPDQDAIARAIASMCGADCRHVCAAVSALAAAVESRGNELIFEMALGLYRDQRQVTVSVAGRLARVAQTACAEHLTQLCNAIAKGSAASPRILEEQLVRAKAELDRVVFTLREEAIGHLCR